MSGTALRYGGWLVGAGVLAVAVLVERPVGGRAQVRGKRAVG
jgi:hypothetical protein